MEVKVLPEITVSLTEKKAILGSMLVAYVVTVVVTLTRKDTLFLLQINLFHFKGCLIKWSIMQKEHMQNFRILGQSLMGENREVEEIKLKNCCK